jgi:hypothetical protein
VARRGVSTRDPAAMAQGKADARAAAWGRTKPTVAVRGFDKFLSS